MKYNVVFSGEARAKLDRLSPTLAADFAEFISIIERSPKNAGVPAYFQHRKRGRMIPFKTIDEGQLLYCFIFFAFRPDDVVIVTNIVAGTRD